MGMQYRCLTEAVRKLMLEEIEHDINSRNVYVSTRLNAAGKSQWINLNMNYNIDEAPPFQVDFNR